MGDYIYHLISSLHLDLINLTGESSPLPVGVYRATAPNGSIHHGRLVAVERNEKRAYHDSNSD